MGTTFGRLPSDYRIPREAAERILTIFGVSETTKAYRRWIRDEDIRVGDLGGVLAEDSPFILIVDWRDVLQDALKDIASALARLDVSLELDTRENADSVEVQCGSRRALVSYSPSDGDLHSIFRVLRDVVPEHIEFRVVPSSWFGDTAIYAVLPKEDWQKLERIAPEFISDRFAGPEELGERRTLLERKLKAKREKSRLKPWGSLLLFGLQILLGGVLIWLIFRFVFKR